MGIINVSLPNDGETADAADYNTPINTIVNEINGNLDNANIDANAAIAGSKLADDSVTSAKVDFGGSGAGIWWEEIGRTTLGSAGDSITVAGLTPKKYLKVLIYMKPSGGITGQLVFNSDTASNYAFYRVTNGSGASNTSANNISVDVDSLAIQKWAVCEIVNIATIPKFVNAHITSEGGSGVATAPSIRTVSGKWQNTSDAITSITVNNVAAGDFDAGSEVVVLGHD